MTEGGVINVSTGENVFLIRIAQRTDPTVHMIKEAFVNDPAVKQLIPGLKTTMFVLKGGGSFYYHDYIRIPFGATVYLEMIKGRHDEQHYIKLKATRELPEAHEGHSLICLVKVLCGENTLYFELPENSMPWSDFKALVSDRLGLTEFILVPENNVYRLNVSGGEGYILKN
jgi:hypothetical protein